MTLLSAIVSYKSQIQNQILLIISLLCTADDEFYGRVDKRLTRKKNYRRPHKSYTHTHTHWLNFVLRSTLYCAPRLIMHRIRRLIFLYSVLLLLLSGVFFELPVALISFTPSPYGDNKFSLEHSKLTKLITKHVHCIFNYRAEPLEVYS